METKLLGHAAGQPDGYRLCCDLDELGINLTIHCISVGITDEIFVTKEQALKLAKLIQEKYDSKS
jgi:hypothetical protein